VSLVIIPSAASPGSQEAKMVIGRPVFPFPKVADVRATLLQANDVFSANHSSSSSSSSEAATETKSRELSSKMPLWQSPKSIGIQPVVFKPLKPFKIESFRGFENFNFQKSLKKIPGRRAPLAFQPSSDSVKHRYTGNELLKSGQFQEALREYEQASQLSAFKKDPDIEYDKGLAYLGLNDQTGQFEKEQNPGYLEKAIGCFQSVLEKYPTDTSSRMYLADTLRRLGRFEDTLTVSDPGRIPGAISEYSTVVAQNPQFDPASRRLAYSKLLNTLAQSSSQQPALLGQTLQSEGMKRWEEAKVSLKDYFETVKNRPDLSALVDKMHIEFDKTNTVNGHANMAEFTLTKPPHGVIRFSEEMAYANPLVLAALGAHEIGVHAADGLLSEEQILAFEAAHPDSPKRPVNKSASMSGDELDSIAEEFTGYVYSSEFWNQYNVSRKQQSPNYEVIEDDNLDRMFELWKHSPQSLLEEVQPLYQSLPGITMYSPGHGEEELQSLLMYS
jgi:tetratricopeptide (TPR) repeat protein